MESVEKYGVIAANLSHQVERPVMVVTRLQTNPSDKQPRKSKTNVTSIELNQSIICESKLNRKKENDEENWGDRNLRKYKCPCLFYLEIHLKQ